MKVDPKTLQSVFLRPETGERTGKSAHGNPAEDFAAILEAQTNASQVKSPNPSLGLDESSASLLTNSLLGMLQTGQAASTPSTLALPGVDDEVDSVLSVLDNYVQALGAPSKTLKEIAPLADDLDRGATRLDQLAASLAEDDPLKGLTSDTAVLAAVEAIKFRRGDLV